MKIILYSPDALAHLYQLKQELALIYGKHIGQKIPKHILNSIHDLQLFSNKGSSVENMFGIPCDYRMLYVEHLISFTGPAKIPSSSQTSFMKKKTFYGRSSEFHLKILILKRNDLSFSLLPYLAIPLYKPFYCQSVIQISNRPLGGFYDLLRCFALP